MLRQLLMKACRIDQVATWLVVSILSFTSVNADAVPAFARQTGQNCVACHAGGQFPELTPYGRLFKLTGYTIGQRALPLSMMAVLTANKVKVNDPAATGHAQDGKPIFSTASLFIAGKISDTTGGFMQITYNNYAGDTGYAGHTGSDNLDLRYVDHFINDKQDLIYGLTLHNNPGVQDVWNSTPAWGYGVVPGSTAAGGALTPMLDGGLAQQVAGIGAYAYWNKTVYAELTGYRTGDGIFSFMTQGNGGQINIKGTNPYLRLALTHEWGPHNAMIGLSRLDVHQYTDPTSHSGPTDRYRDNSIDFQYQYLLDPYTVTATLTRIHENIDPATAGLLSDTVNSLRAKASFIYQAKYGATLSYFDVSNSSNANGFFASQNPPVSRTGTRGWTPEIFWMPVQYVRTGVQYTMFNADSAAPNPKASDNNTLFFYVWGAY
ncbi:cytochrome c [Sulfuriferula plumbiphila]|uniref:Cytochrome c n=1 Tax=Sulfuriferula plumbiphila TaxID=171865 RepID=A0A512L5A7_9PROT|nr:cytochrome C [Sulfuriferula plumbiphila]BBP05893.1 cytochrome c [Sulfuriferula plumbiphila]GEP29663.1 cytochrome c [Sulfuriferula plumbiphila]